MKKCICVFTSILSTLILSPNAEAQIDIYGSAYVNLEVIKEIREFDDTGVSQASYDGKCSGSQISISKNCEIKLSSYAKNCNATLIAVSSGLWKARNISFTGTQGKNIPLNVNFEVTGNQDLVTTPGLTCYNSIASSLVKFTASSNNSEISTLSHLQHNNGFESYSDVEGFDTSNIKAEIRPVIAFGYNLVDYIALEKSWIDKFLRNLSMYTLDALTGEDAKMDDKFLEFLTGGIEVGRLSEYKITVSKNEGKMLNAMRYMMSLGVDLLPVEPSMLQKISPVVFRFDVKYKHKYKKSVRLNTTSGSNLNVYLYNSSSTIPICEARANTDFSNTLKIASITVAEEYDASELAGMDIMVHFDKDVSIPVSFDIITSVENQNKIDLKLYPNPTDDYFIIDIGTKVHVKSVMLLDLSGKQVAGQKIDNVTEKVRFDLPNNLLSSQYIVRLYTDRGVYSNKLLVK